MPTVTLLGPQRLRPTLAEVVDDLEIAGPVAAVTAGWQEREAEDDELREHLGGGTVNLLLHRRAEEVFAEDPELFEAHRERQAEIRERQGLYRLRLAGALDVARQLLARPERSDLVEEATDSALAAVRRLDGEHLDRLGMIHRRFAGELAPLERPAVARHREELAEILAGTSALAIAGGHVAVLLNRLRLFGLLELAAGQPLLAWSAGAMVLAEQVVVFHDAPPQGAGNPEVLEVGLSAVPELLPLPHARRRLRLGHPLRVALFARRFAPLASITLDEGDQVSWNGTFWSVPAAATRLAEDGTLAPFSGGPGERDG